MLQLNNVENDRLLRRVGASGGNGKEIASRFEFVKDLTLSGANELRRLAGLLMERVNEVQRSIVAIPSPENYRDRGRSR